MPRSRGRNGRFHSRNIAKIRHNTNVLRRQARYSIQQGGQVYATLLAVLAQSGGDIVVTKGTLDQVGANMAGLGFTVVQGVTETEFIVRLVEGKQPEAEPGPSVATVQSELTPTEEVPDAVG